ncbi:MAG: nickel pincer cofactor biosynthesis protein LarB [Elusimicrobiota bacterium]
MTKNKFACVDTGRLQRQGFPEAVYCPGKTIGQIIKIVEELFSANRLVLATRADKKVYLRLKKIFPQAQYSQAARLIVIKGKKFVLKKTSSRYILVITAGTADIPVGEEAALTAEVLGNKVSRLYDVGVAGIHRLFRHQEILQKAAVVVVCAGMEGALASVVGGLVSVPVVAVPTSVGYGAAFQGVSALLTMLNSCASNVSVVNIDNGFGAGIIANLINREQ